MKTAVVMERKLCGKVVRQNHKTRMFNANDLHLVGNDLRKQAGLTQKQAASYFNLDSTKELINQICIIENLSSDDVKKSTRGKYGGTWVHPILFADMAMWYSPELKVKILKWVMDGLLDVRDNSGDSYKKMASALKQSFTKEFTPLKMAEVANTIAAECRVGNGSGRWEKASQVQLDKRDSIQSAVALIADMCPNIGTAVSKAIIKTKHV